MSEDYRMTIFDAATLALTFFHFSQAQELQDRENEVTALLN
jgi:hypothetical protein